MMDAVKVLIALALMQSKDTLTVGQPANIDMCISNVIESDWFNLVYEGSDNGTNCGCRLNYSPENIILLKIDKFDCESAECQWKLAWSSPAPCRENVCCTKSFQDTFQRFSNQTSGVDIVFTAEQPVTGQINILLTFLARMTTKNDPRLQIECGLSAPSLSVYTGPVCTTTTTTTTQATTRSTASSVAAMTTDGAGSGVATTTDGAGSVAATTTDGAGSGVATTTDGAGSVAATTTDGAGSGAATTVSNDKSINLAAVIGGSSAAAVIVIIVIIIIIAMFLSRKKKIKQPRGDGENAVGGGGGDDTQITYAYNQHLEPQPAQAPSHYMTPPQRDSQTAYAYNNHAYTGSYDNDGRDSNAPTRNSSDGDALYSQSRKQNSTMDHRERRLPRQPSADDDIAYARDFVDQEFNFIDNDLYSSR